VKVSRDYHEALRRAGIQNPGDVDVGQPVFTIPLDESLRETIAPVTVPVVGGFAVEAAVAGRHSGLRVQAGGRGIWLLEVAEVGGAVGHSLIVAATLPFDTTTAAIVPGFLPSGAMDSVLTQGNILTANLPPGSYFLRASSVFRPSHPIWIPRGVSVLAVNFTANTVGQYSILFREVPTRGANPDED
jgi:hypothetical protein